MCCVVTLKLTVKNEIFTTWVVRNWQKKKKDLNTFSDVITYNKLDDIFC